MNYLNQQVRELASLIRRVASLPLDAPIFVVAAAADAIIQKRAQVLRAISAYRALRDVQRAA